MFVLLLILLYELVRTMDGSIVRCTDGPCMHRQSDVICWHFQGEV